MLQVQGKFRKPIANAKDVYVGKFKTTNALLHCDITTLVFIYYGILGLESTCSMGMMSKSICRAMLKFLSNSMPSGSVDHSLGDSRSNAAFVCAPLLACVDRLCITPAGSAPPSMRYEFQEAQHHRAQRKSGKYGAVNGSDGSAVNASSTKTVTTLGFDTSSTYSFTIKGKYIDFCEWSTCGFRMMNPTNLGTFIGSKSSLRLVAFVKTPLVGSAASPRGVSPTTQQGASTSVDMSKKRPGISYLLQVDIAANNDAFGSTSQFLSPGYSKDSDSENEEIEIAEELTVADRRSDTPDSIFTGTLTFCAICI